MEVKLYREDGTYIEIKNVVGVSQLEKEYKIIADETYVFDIVDHTIINQKTKEIFVKTVETLERLF